MSSDVVKGKDAAYVNETHNLEFLENDFQQVLSELMGDKSLERFRHEYEKLHGALKKSHSQEKKLVKKCRELNAEIVNNASKVQTALKLSQEDQQTIASLRKEMEKAWKMVDISHEKEVHAKDTIQQLKDEITNLTVMVQRGAGISVGQETMMKEVVKARDDLLRANEENETNARLDRERIQQLHHRITELESQGQKYKRDIHEYKEQMAVRKADQDRENRRRERYDKEIKDLKAINEKRSAELNSVSTDFNRSNATIQGLEKQLTETRNTVEKYMRDNDSSHLKVQKLTEMVNDQHDRNMQLEQERQEYENEIKAKSEEITKLVSEKSVTERKLDKEKRSVLMMQQKVDDERNAKQVLQNEIKSMQGDLDRDKKNEEAQSGILKGVERDRQIQLKNVKKAEQKTKQVEDVVKTKERVNKNLEIEFSNFKQEAAKQRKLIYQLEKDRERYGIEASEQRSCYLQAVDELKLREMSLNDLQKKVHEGEGKLKQQQQLYEAVRSDRNLYSKNLIEAQDEIAEMKRKSKIMNHQIEQLKEEITAKDHALVKEHFDLQKVEKQKDQTKSELGRLRNLISSNEETITNQDSEVRKLTHMIHRMDDEALEQRKEYDQVINERDILGTQLIRRNDELALLYEKLKIQQSTLKKGEAQYQERMSDIRILRLKINDLKREVVLNKNSVGQVDELKQQVYHLQREILEEKTKVKALSEELENPMNVHRWRKLEGSDPATFEMIQKIQTLQKRLIRKTEEVVEKDLLLNEKEKLYIELKNILARQPGPEVAEQLSIYQANLKEKSVKMKALVSELNMYQAQVHDYKYEIERQQRENQDLKRKYYQRKLKDKMGTQNADTMPSVKLGNSPAKSSNLSAGGTNIVLNSKNAELQRNLAQASQPRFLGGGFNLNQ